MLKCAILQQAATLATATSKTVTIPISVANEDPNFGVYAVPGLKSHVVVGPFKTKEAVNMADDDDNFDELTDTQHCQKKLPHKAQDRNKRIGEPVFVRQETQDNKRKVKGMRISKVQVSLD